MEQQLCCSAVESLDTVTESSVLQADVERESHQSRVNWSVHVTEDPHNGYAQSEPSVFYYFFF